ncbi:MAG: sugar ABC transporter substrate-binding protein [Lachnospiraceae bacterium]
MKVIRHKAAVLVCLLLVMVLSGACASSPGSQTQETTTQGAQEADSTTEEAPVVIGATLASEDSTYIKSLETYMQKEALSQGAELKIEYAQWDAQIQTQQIRTFIQEKVDVIIVCPVDAKSLLTPLKEAEKAEIPVINVNMRVDAISSIYVDSYVGASNSQEATMAAELAIAYLGEEGGQIGIIEGAPGSDTQVYRTQTFVEQLASHPQIEVVAISGGKWEREQASLSAWDILTKFPQLRLIYCHDSDLALGASEQIEELGRDVAVIGIGENEEYLQAVLDGKIYGLVTQPVSYEGQQAILSAVNAAKGETLKPWYKDPIEVVTKENAAEVLASILSEN